LKTGVLNNFIDRITIYFSNENEVILNVIYDLKHIISKLFIGNIKKHVSFQRTKEYSLA